MPTLKKVRFRRHLSAPGLVSQVRACFERVKDPLRSRKASLADHMMAALAMFMFKFPSMLDFDDKARGPEADPELLHNLGTMFGLRHVPCDTAMRERLDDVEPEALRPAFKKVISRLQRGKGLEGLTVIDDNYLVAIDGTEYFKSERVSCRHCCVRNKTNGKAEHYHQMLCASIVNPGSSAAFPLILPEMITKADGATKNDCEMNAFKRLLPALRREHPHMKIAVLLDGLYGKAPQIRLLRKYGMGFLIGVKKSDHKALFGQIEVDGESWETTDKDGVVHRFRWRNGAELNNSHRDLLVNAMTYTEITPAHEVRKGGGKTRTVDTKFQRFAWVTDFDINPDTLMPLMRAGRARWRIENNIFNTMKNQEFDLGHNFGHGDQHLSSVLACMMMLAYLIDQVQERCCAVFQAARQRCRSRVGLWRRMQSRFTTVYYSGWEEFMEHLAGFRKRAPPPATA